MRRRLLLLLRMRRVRLSDDIRTSLTLDRRWTLLDFGFGRRGNGRTVLVLRCVLRLILRCVGVMMLIRLFGRGV